jgi:hypothetical protein
MAPTLNKPAPAFTLGAVVDGEFKTVSLSDYKGAHALRAGLQLLFASPASACHALLCGARIVPPSLSSAAASHPTPPGKYVVLFFYPLDFTFVCPVRSSAHGGWPTRRRFCAEEAASLQTRRPNQASSSPLTPPPLSQTEICAFSDRAAEFAKLDTVVRSRSAAPRQIAPPTPPPPAPRLLRGQPVLPPGLD